MLYNPDGCNAEHFLFKRCLLAHSGPLGAALGCLLATLSVPSFSQHHNDTSLSAAVAVQFIRQICDGMAAYLMDKSDFNKIMMRAAARELLAACVVRPIMYYFTPYNINKVTMNQLVRPSVASCCACGFCAMPQGMNQISPLHNCHLCCLASYAAVSLHALLTLPGMALGHKLTAQLAAGLDSQSPSDTLLVMQHNKRHVAATVQLLAHRSAPICKQPACFSARQRHAPARY